MFARIDDWLFRRVFEPIAHEFEAWIGLSNFVLAWAMLIVWGAATVSMVFLRDGAIQIAWIACAAFVPMVLGLNYFALRDAERRASRRNFGNADKVAPFSRLSRGFFGALALISALLCILTVRLDPADIGQFAFWAHWYFQACDPMPPKKQRSLVFWRSAQTQPTGA